MYLKHDELVAVVTLHATVRVRKRQQQQPVIIIIISSIIVSSSSR